ncbi:amidase signature domain-containing protein [Aspergillus varians]
MGSNYAGRSSIWKSFEQLEVKCCDDQFFSVALPLRIKSSATTDSPIVGWRVVVKDNAHLQGIKTSVGNRAFHNTYPPQPETAKCIQLLLDQGVVIAGKTKMNSFGNLEKLLEYIDYQAPCSPRADGYQSTWGSSSGSSVAVAAYDLVDIAIGTDSESTC